MPYSKSSEDKKKDGEIKPQVSENEKSQSRDLTGSSQDQDKIRSESDKSEDKAKYFENMARLKRKQIMNQNNYEIMSITEAGIEDGSSVMQSEFKYG
jgi:hypothetical protein